VKTTTCVPTRSRTTPTLLRIATEDEAIVELVGRKVDILSLIRRWILVLLRVAVVDVVIVMGVRRSERGSQAATGTILPAWQRLRRTAPGVRGWQLDVPGVTDVTEEQVGDGPMHHAVPVDSVERAVVRLTPESVMQVHDVEAVIGNDLKLRITRTALGRAHTSRKAADVTKSLKSQTLTSLAV